MFLTYLRRELLNRKRQTLIVSIGMAVAIGLVVVVTAVSAGVKSTQQQVLGSLYGVGTDISITQTAVPGSDNPGRFQFGSGGNNQQAGGVRTLSRSNLRVQRGSQTFDAATVTKVKAVQNVTSVATALSLNQISFTGTLPTFNFGGFRNRQNQGGSGSNNGSAQDPGGDDGAVAGMPPFGATTGTDVAQNPSTTIASKVTTTTTATAVAPSGGADGKGGSAFSIDSFSVMGVDPSVTNVGPLSSTTVTSGRGLAATDAGKDLVLVDSDYATSNKLAVNSTVTIKDTKFTVVGIVGSNTATSGTAANTYIPIDVAQTLSGNTGVVTNIYVKASSGNSIDAVASALKTALPDATVSTSSDLAKTVSGSITTASTLVNNMGKWLSILVLAAAFLMAILFTVSGVTRRTREFGTLKAIGWRNGQIVRQVVGETLVQGFIGALIGIGLGEVGISIINNIAPKLTASTAGLGGFRGGFNGGGGFFGGSNTGGNSANPLAAARRALNGNTFDVVLHSSMTVKAVSLAIALAVVGGVLAGVFGGLRAARLRPAEAMRSVA
jgi:ABC-type lipoprotein release transport system permease subunit